MIPWTVTPQAPPSMGFPRQEYWTGLPFPSPEDLPDPGIKSASPAWQVDSLPLHHQEAHSFHIVLYNFHYESVHWIGLIAYLPSSPLLLLIR